MIIFVYRPICPFNNCILKKVVHSFLEKRLMQFVSLFFILLLFMNCSDKESSMENQIIQQNMERTENSVTNYLGPQSFLALGDSYTIGTGIQLELNWPYQLKDKLIQDNVASLEVNIIAQNGWTTSRLLEAIKMNDPDSHDLVSLMIGVNNQFQRLPFNTFKKEFNELLQIAIRLSGEKRNIFVVSIPDYSVTRYGSGDPDTISKDIDRYNEYIEEQCDKLNLQFVDVTQISRELGGSRSVIADDGLHPNASQYSRWLEEIAPVVKTLFENDSE